MNLLFRNCIERSGLYFSSCGGSVLILENDDKIAANIVPDMRKVRLCNRWVGFSVYYNFKLLIINIVQGVRLDSVIIR